MSLRVLFVGILWSVHYAAGAQPIEPAPLVVETVECRGNKNTTCEFIKTKLGIHSGSTADDDAVHSAQLRLSALSIFTSVRVYLEKGSETGKAALIVDVIEASAIVTEYALGGAYGYADPGVAVPQSTEIWTGTIGARVSNQNLFGTGKIAALSGGGRYETRDFEARASNSNLDFLAKITAVQLIASYIDPNLFGTERFFLSLGAGYGESKTAADSSFVDPRSGYRQDSNATQELKNFDARVSLGYRLWSYSYLFGSYRYSRSQLEFGSISTSTLSYAYSTESEVHTASLGVGWDSEDDAFFPTRGSRISVTGDYKRTTEYYQGSIRMFYPEDSFEGHGALKSTWSFGTKSIVTLHIGDEPDDVNDQLRPLVSPFPGDLGVTYSYALSSLGAKRSRWYLHAGADSDTKHLSLGLRFESRTLGLVDLYATGSQSSQLPGLRTGPIMGN